MQEHIRQSNLIEGIDSPKEDEQSLHAWEQLVKHQGKLDHGVICKTQKLITLNQKDLVGPERGYYRDMSKVNVTIAGHMCPEYRFVPDLMSNWLLDYEELGPWKAHVRFETIHPFVDGNGRTGRMLMWWHEIAIDKMPTLFKVSERQAYYDKLNEDR